MLAALLRLDGELFYIDGTPPQCVIKQLLLRKDNQIMALELLPIALGLSTFATQLAHRSVHVFSDNTGSEWCAKRGTARAWDHARIVHMIWKLLAMERVDAWFDRVPTSDNIADLPSRESYGLVEQLGGQWTKPVLHDSFSQLDSFEALSLR